MAKKGAGDLSSLRKELSAGRIASAYLLYGSETFLKEQAAAAIRKAVLGEGEEDSSAWNLAVLEGGSAALVDILDAARTLPMLAPRRLVLVRDAEKLRESDATPLKEYLKDPPPTSCILFVSGTGKPDLRRSIFRTLHEADASLEFEALKGRAVPSWIRERVREKGAQIEEDALALLEVHLGNDLLRIDAEMTKVLEFLAPSRTITVGGLDETLGSAGAGSVFELAEKVGAGETGEAIRLLRGILAEGEEPVRLLFLITRQVRILILGEALMKKGHRGRDLALGLGIAPLPFIIEKTQGLIARFPESAGAPCIRRILEADRALKGGTGRGPAILEGLVIDLADLIARRSGGREARV